MLLAFGLNETLLNFFLTTTVSFHDSGRTYLAPLQTGKHSRCAFTKLLFAHISSLTKSKRMDSATPYIPPSCAQTVVAADTATAVTAHMNIDPSSDPVSSLDREWNTKKTNRQLSNAGKVARTSECIRFSPLMQHQLCTIMFLSIAF